MKYETILYEAEGGIATLTINRPDVLNALNMQVLAEMLDAISRIEADEAVKVVVLTGAGRSFIAGADIALMSGFCVRDGMKFGDMGHAVLKRLEALDKPVIAAVNGFALGGGTEVSLGCDFVYASTRAKFGQPEVNLGIIPGFGGTQRLARLVGEGRALEMLLVGAPIDAARAFEIGLANRVVEGSALDGALALADEIAAVGPEAARACLRAVREGLRLPLGAGLELEARLFGQAFAGDEMREGTAAFMEKRPPRFAGR